MSLGTRKFIYTISNWHLASLLGLSNNNDISSFYPAGIKPHFKIKLVLDFYGIFDFLAFKESVLKDPHNGITLLLGATASDRPDQAENASPVTYIDKNDPPFLIVHGEKDESVDPNQSVLLSSKLKDAGVKNELMVVSGAPHAGEMFDAEYIRKKVFLFLNNYLK